ncbi:hypothetical protein [Cystobacter fuscus]|uniref:hypothetical protein n=1 Tax=Cystobacter fuscus TaxID=43 RepID=UPI002B2AAB8E|nr:hypothetical protein F0U63_18665 [Cystobacter fuscus]
MMKALKMGLFGLAMGALGAVAFPAHEAEAQVIAQPLCCSSCNPRYQRCITNAGGDINTLLICTMQRQECESTCKRTC